MFGTHKSGQGLYSFLEFLFATAYYTEGILFINHLPCHQNERAYPSIRELTEEALCSNCRTETSTKGLSMVITNTSVKTGALHNSWLRWQIQSTTSEGSRIEKYACHTQMANWKQLENDPKLIRALLQFIDAEKFLLSLTSCQYMYVLTSI